MKGWLKAIAVLIVVAILLVAGIYIYNKTKGSADADTVPDNHGDPSQLVEVNESAVSVYFGSLAPYPSLADLTVRLYAPGQGHADWSLASSPASAGVLCSGQLFPGIGLSYHDLNNDSQASKGEYLTVQCEWGPLGQGIWHIELRYPGHTSGNTTFHFHVLPAGVQSIPECLEVDFIDVGQGDAELVTTSDGKHVLIDTGTDLSRSSLLSYLNNRSVTVLDALIISHPDADHIGGAGAVLRSLEVRSVYHPGLVRDTWAYTDFINAAKAEGCSIHTSADVQKGDYLNVSVTEDFRVLSINASSESNDASIVLRLTAETRSFLFTGDIDTSIEDILVKEYPQDLKVDVLKVSHHGSSYASSDAFLDIAAPSLAVIEVGPNSYGHPSNETLSRLAEHQVTVVRTDVNGTYPVLVKDGAVIS